MKSEELCSPEMLRELLDYDPETGDFIWNLRPLRYFPDDRAMRSWNTRFAGKQAFKTQTRRSGLQATIFDEKVFAHRAAWAIVHGHWPPQMVDHINGDKADNRISNLRAVGPAENARNSSIASHNNSGVTGVSWDADRGRWFAKIHFNNRQYALGRYAEFADAIAARRAAEQRFGFHENHGRPRRP